MAALHFVNGTEEERNVCVFGFWNVRFFKYSPLFQRKVDVWYRLILHPMDTANYRVLPESSNEGYRSETVFEN